MPIEELSRRLGVSTDLVRKWERRYAVLKPGRTIGNQRLYSHLDAARAQVMLRHIRNGVPPQAAELAIATRFKIASGTTSEATTDQLAVARGEMQGRSSATTRRPPSKRSTSFSPAQLQPR